MTALAASIGLFIAAVGIAGVVTPDGLLAAIRYAVTPAGLYAVAALRVGFGLVLLRVASVSRAPRTLRLLGFLILVNGLITPFVGVDRARALLDWWAAQGPAVIRLWAGLALALGILVIFAVAPRRGAV